MIEARPSIPRDTILWKSLRTADLSEIQASSGRHPQLALLTGLQASSECFTIYALGEEETPLAMFGVVPQEDPLVGQVWLLGADALKKHAFPQRVPDLVQQH